MKRMDTQRAMALIYLIVAFATKTTTLANSIPKVRHFIKLRCLMNVITPFVVNAFKKLLER